mmetsp:Transcript_8915/g.20028  ORF Transcript_8915/g.20028 Transcript_8915/m.20028 type:complete len:563 (+) Transcript_8915:436-2124(+)|eukprot:CAMPEP_0172325866 /NCGR_PEP_ID=MMETSP1058-20130122/54898_1 /TAXON_ID=83371 /ORGANISM="Detonula confervacea, Strain CCMP 353" /LENGTH=562 /DNA_ID=CAMNT_0013042497 /DNA_START=406 /DNA_END=2094 /DNA_ORIENTATION=+
MERKEGLVEQAASRKIAGAAHSRKQMPSSKNEAKQSLPRSPIPTMKTESTDTDSASISASAFPVQSSSSPTTHASPSQQEARPGLNQLQVALKVLVSNSASGLIIGRSGSTISDLQAKSLTRIKLSQGGDYYPGTSDRVCLIQGFLPNSSLAVEMVFAKLYELQYFQQVPSTPATTNPSENLPDQNASISFIVRLLVPSTCCGMIIGRGGSNIKSLKEKSKVTYIQLSPKEHEVMIDGFTLSTAERIMTITGPNFTSCVNCVRIILSDMAQNPEISRYINMTTSYSKNWATAPSAYAVAPTSVFFLEHEPFQQSIIGQHQIVESPPRYSPTEQFVPGQFELPSMAGMQIQSEQNIGLLPQPTYDTIAHGEMPFPLRGDPSTMIQSQPYGQDMMSSPPRIASLGPSSLSFPQYSSQVGQTMQFWAPDISTCSPDRNILPSPVDQLSQNFQAQVSLQSHPSHSSLQHLASPLPVTAQLGVPDMRIGSILGRGGKTLTEIQAKSRTKIRISQRGEFIPGTQNRIVTITGNSTQDVELAQHLVNQRLNTGSSRSSSSSELRQSKNG